MEHRTKCVGHHRGKRWTISAIACRLSLDRKTVRRFCDTDLAELLASAQDRRPNGVLEPFKPYLKARFTEAQGQVSGTRLFLEIQARRPRQSAAPGALTGALPASLLRWRDGNRR